MSRIHYNQRTFINAPDSHYTGSLVCFDGQDLINQGKVLARYTFVELSDCHDKVRIHCDLNHDLLTFIHKLKTVQRELAQFIDYLEADDESRR